MVNYRRVYAIHITIPRRTTLLVFCLGIYYRQRCRSIGNRFIILGQSPFYRTEEHTADNTSALIFASDDQLDLFQFCALHEHGHVVHHARTEWYHHHITIYSPCSFPTPNTHLRHFNVDDEQQLSCVELFWINCMSLFRSQFQPTQIIADFEEAPVAATRNDCLFATTRRGRTTLCQVSMCSQMTMVL